MTVDLTPLFAPRGVAVLGASRNPAKLGHRLVQNLLAPGFSGDIIPVNPSGETILGRDAVTRVEDLPRGLDLALVSLPAKAVLPAVRALGARGCRMCVILASGFGETGRAGRIVQEEIEAIGRTSGMRIVGPNCMGVVNVPGRLNASYFWDVPRQPGGISFVSQSGAYGGLFFREVRERSLGVAKFLSIGNQSDLGFTECLAWLADDPDTRVVGLFVEGIRDGRAFVAAARRLARTKPVVALKGGRAEAGRRAAGSHTGSLAGAWETYRAAFAAAGIVVVEETEELFDAMVTLEAHGSRLPRDAAVAVLTISGGPSVVAADAAEAAGLRVPALPEERRRALRAHLPDFGADGNPVDMTPQMEPAGFEPSVRLVLEAPEVSGAVAIDIGLDRPEYADALVAAQAATGKPVVACTVDTPDMDRRLRAAGIPLVPGPERAVRAYRALVRHAELRRRVETAAVDRPPPTLPAGLVARLAAARGSLGYADARALLEAYGVLFPRAGEVQGAVLQGPEHHARAACRVRAAFRRTGDPSRVSASSRSSGTRDPRARRIEARTGESLSHGRVVARDPVDGIDPAMRAMPRGRRRHDLDQHGGGLRESARRREGPDRQPQGHARIPAAFRHCRARGPARGDAQAIPAGDAPRGAHAPRVR